MNNSLEQVKKNQAADEGEKADAFMKALGEFAGLRWNDALLEATGPGGRLWEKYMTVEDEYHKVFAEVENKIGFRLTDRLTTLKGELDSLGLDYVYYQGLRDGARLYRMLTGE